MFWLAVAFVSLLLAGGIVYLRARNIQSRNNELSELIADKTKILEEQNQKLELHQNHLEVLVKVRTRELERAKEKAEESDRLKSAFLANMSHEIRTPLNAIVGFSEILTLKFTQEGRSEEVEEIKQIITNSTRGLLRLIEDILEISQADAGSLQVEKTDVDIGELCTRLSTLYSVRIRDLAEDLVFKSEIEAGEGLLIETDGHRVEQILINLLDNAIKFTDTGSITLKIELDRETVRISVVDTGIGISASQQSNVFGRFVKTEKTQNRLYGGVGLGLSICQSLSELLGGSIELESEEGVGSTFTLVLPFAAAQLPNQDKAAETLDASYDWSGKRVLVAEDEESNYLLMESLIAPTGASIERALDGDEAVRKAIEDPHLDLVLMDIRMPLLDGVEAVNLIKASKPSLAVIAQTANVMVNDRDSLLQAGFDDSVEKPFDQLSLLALMDSYLSKSHSL